MIVGGVKFMMCNFSSPFHDSVQAAAILLGAPLYSHLPLEPPWNYSVKWNSQSWGSFQSPITIKLKAKVTPIPRHVIVHQHNPSILPCTVPIGPALN